MHVFCELFLILLAVDDLDESSDALVIDEGLGGQVSKKTPERHRQTDRSNRTNQTAGGPSLGSVQIIENEPMELDSSEVSRAGSANHNQASQNGTKIATVLN